MDRKPDAYIAPCSIKIKVLLFFNTKFQPNIPSHSGENGDFTSFALFTILKSWSLIMLHMKFGIHGCSGLKE